MDLKKFANDIRQSLGSPSRPMCHEDDPELLFCLLAPELIALWEACNDEMWNVQPALDALNAKAEELLGQRNG